MDMLAILFGGAVKVKIVRLFLFNPGYAYDVRDIVARSRVPEDAARKEMKQLEKAGLIKRRIFYKLQKKRNGELADTKHKVSGWTLSDRFLYTQALSRFLIDVPPFDGKQLLSWFSRVGKIKLLITSGFFIQNPNSRVDLLVVGDMLRKGPLEMTIGRIESELGKEIRYVALETEEFQYRVSVYDKLIRDILDYPHIVVLDRIGIRKEIDIPQHLL